MQIDNDKLGTLGERFGDIPLRVFEKQRAVWDQCGWKKCTRDQTEQTFQHVFARAKQCVIDIASR